jgi:hypothetical protein
MNEKRKFKRKENTNELIKIILYMVFMTTFFMIYYCENNNDKNEKSLIDNYHSYYNEDIISAPANGNLI